MYTTNFEIFLFCCRSIFFFPIGKKFFFLSFFLWFSFHFSHHFFFLFFPSLLFHFQFPNYQLLLILLDILISNKVWYNILYTSQKKSISENPSHKFFFLVSTKKLLCNYKKRKKNAESKNFFSWFRGFSS